MVGVYDGVGTHYQPLGPRALLFNVFLLVCVAQLPHAYLADDQGVKTESPKIHDVNSF